VVYKYCMSYVAHITSPGRVVSNMRNELDMAVAELASHHPLIVIDVNSTLSSQILVDSFQRQQIPYGVKGNTLPEGSAYLHGVYGPIVVKRIVDHKQSMYYYVDSAHSRESINQCRYELEFPNNPILSIGKNHSAYMLSILIDPMYQGFIYSSEYLVYNQLEHASGILKDTDFWSYYIEPLLVAHHWGDSITYRDAVPGLCEQDFVSDTAYINLTILTKFLSKNTVSSISIPSNAHLVS
jgi:hypothetical protein